MQNARTKLLFIPAQLFGAKGSRKKFNFSDLDKTEMSVMKIAIFKQDLEKYFILTNLIYR